MLKLSSESIIQSPKSIRLLIVQQPWAGYIFSSQKPKTIEIRARKLTRKSFGRVGIQVAGANEVIGAVDIVDCKLFGPFNCEKLSAFEDRTRASAEEVGQIFGNIEKPLYLWQLANAKSFPAISHHIKRGARIFEVVDSNSTDYERLSLAINSVNVVM